MRSGGLSHTLSNAIFIRMWGEKKIKKISLKWSLGHPLFYFLAANNCRNYLLNSMTSLSLERLSVMES